MDAYFVLGSDGYPRRELDVLAWSRWYEHAHRSLARTTVAKGVIVLTVFTGFCDLAEADEPRLFETRVFGGVLDGEEVSVRTRSDALLVHAELAEWCRIGQAFVYGVGHG